MKKKANDGTGNIARGTAIIIIAMVIVFGAVFAWMYSMDMLFLPRFIEDLFDGADKDESPWDLGTLSALVKEGKDEAGQSATFDITYENMRAALLGAEPEEGIFFNAETFYYDGGVPHSRLMSYYRKGERFRIEHYKMTDDDTSALTLETLKIYDGQSLYVLDSRSGESGVTALDIAVSPENEAGIPSIDALIKAIEKFPENEGAPTSTDSLITDTVLKLVRTDSGNVYYVAFTYSDIGLFEEYYVSVEHGIVISMQSRQSGELVYSFEVKTFSDDASDYSDEWLYEPSESAEQ